MVVLEVNVAGFLFPGALAEVVDDQQLRHLFGSAGADSNQVRHGKNVGHHPLLP
jgi:hypothetical protein